MDRRVCWLTAILFIVFIGWNSYQYQHHLVQDHTHLENNRNVRMSLDDFIRLRLQESESIWKKGVAIRQKNELETLNSNVNNDALLIDSYRTIWDFFSANFNCPHTVERLGRVGDGGKWVCGISQIAKAGENCVVYSYGISGDTSFEQNVLDRTNCSLHAYDQTSKARRVILSEKYPARATFSRIGLGIQNTKSLRTLKSEMDKRGHTFIDILKVDIEGGEFKCLDKIRSDFPNGLPFGQLLVEIHLGTLPQHGLFKRLKSWWESLESVGLRAFHSEPNLYASSKLKFCEVSFLNVRANHIVLHG